MQIEIADIAPLRKPYFTRLKPPYCAFPVVGLPWQVTPYASCQAARQTHRLVGATIHLFEVEATSAVTINLRIQRPALFLVFILRGNLYFYDQEHMPISDATAPVHYLKYSPSGRFTAKLPAGSHSLLSIRLDDNWFTARAAGGCYPGFATLLEAYFGLRPTFVILPRQAITRKIQRALLDIRTKVILRIHDDLEVLMHISQIIDEYHEEIHNPKETEIRLFAERGQLLKEYLSANYKHDEACNTVQILDVMGWSVWTLRRLCTEVLGCSTRQYIAHLQLEEAVRLLQGSNMQIHDIAIEIGFSCSASFIRAFKKVKGTSPNEYRKRIKKS